jgi:hypothetical protein
MTNSCTERWKQYLESLLCRNRVTKTGAFRGHRKEASGSMKTGNFWAFTNFPGNRYTMKTISRLLPFARQEACFCVELYFISHKEATAIVESDYIAQM